MGWAQTSQEGATAVEYAIMASLIAMVVIGAVALLGTNLSSSYDCTAEHVENLGEDPANVDC